MRNSIGYFILFFFISHLLGAQEINQIDSQGRKQGDWKKYYPSNDGLFYEGQFKDDKPYGVFKHYYEEGELKSKTYYLDGLVRSEVYYPKGGLMAKGNFVDKKKDSTWTYFDEAGWISMREDYKSGLREGKSISYYPDGSIAMDKQFLSDKETGPFKQYFSNGKVEMEGEYLGGNYNGQVTNYYDSGKKMHYGEFINGKRNGMWVFYNADGSVRSMIHYKNGIVNKEDPKNGEFISYYESGMPKTIYNYKDGKLHGVFFEYYDKGQMVLVAREKESSYEPDELVEELQGQKIKRSGTYKNGNLVGEELEYDEKGKLLKKENHGGG